MPPDYTKNFPDRWLVPKVSELHCYLSGFVVNVIIVGIPIGYLMYFGLPKSLVITAWVVGFIYWGNFLVWA